MVASAVGPDATIDEAIRVLNSRRARIIAVCDREGVLLGTLSASDAQSLLLSRVDLSAAVTTVMDANPTTADEDVTPAQLRRAVADSPSLSMPIVSADGRLIRIATIEQGVPAQQDASALVLAGGLGMRMRPLTEGTPKPMLPIHGQPILRHIVEQLEAQGITTVYLAVNYRAEQISDYFGDGQEFGLSVTYLRESTPLGTAGSLRLLPLTAHMPLIVMNGDVLARVDYVQLLRDHRTSGAHATVCTWDYSVTIPYGEVLSDGDRVIAMREKPTLHTEISAGIYVVGREFIALVPEERVDMPDLITQGLSRGLTVRRHRLTEMWIDIGEPREYERAQQNWSA